MQHLTLNDWSRGEEWILFPENLSVSRDEVEGNIEIRWKQNSLFPKGPLIKVAEHSFRARFCWCNWARAQGLQRAIILFTQHPHYLCYFFSIIERSVLMALVFYYKDTLEKVTTQWNQQFSAFSLLPKEPS